MALELNTSSVKLGDTTNSVKPEYTSMYRPAYEDPSQAPEACKIVDPVKRTFQLEGLESLNTLCKFAFPPIFLTPPIYNEPPLIPEACESFTASISVDYLGAASGYFELEPTSTPECAVDISGVIEVIACESFGVSNPVLNKISKPDKLGAKLSLFEKV